MSQACSILRIVVILVYMSIRRFLETSTDVDGGSHRYEWKLGQKEGAQGSATERPGTRVGLKRLRSEQERTTRHRA